MKIFAKYKIGLTEFMKKMLVVFTLITSLATIAPKPVEATGGTLMEPIMDLVVGLGDGTMKYLHKFILKQDITKIPIDLTSGGIKIGRLITTILAILATAALVIFTAGAGAALVGAVGGALEAGSSIATVIASSGGLASVIGTGVAKAALSGIVLVALGTGGFAGALTYNAWKGNEVVLPVYSLTPDAIFSNRVPLFKVNFFNVDEENSKIEKNWTSKMVVTDEIESLSYTPGTSSTNDGEINIWLKNFLGNEDVKTTEIRSRGTKKGDSYYFFHEDKIFKYLVQNEGTPDALFSISYTQANTTETEAQENIYGFNYQLQEIVSAWYARLRMIAIVGMMTVLVYMGIRILLSSTSSQKAKYKQLVGDWFVGVALLFTMHYIMNFANMAVDQLTEIFSNVNPTMNVAWVKDTDGKVSKALEEKGIEIKTNPDEVDVIDNSKVYLMKDQEDEEGNKADYIEWHTDLMGLIRMEAAKDSDEAVSDYIGGGIMFTVMVIYTVIFSWTYIKRVIYMAFLTMIAPLVALTYPIDKANDGKAQGFDYWFKEYIFNLLVQPMHLLLYTILVSSAVVLSQTNWIYSLVALGFIASAEKIVRQMFNFSKASTPGSLSGPAGAALAFSGMRWLFNHGPLGGKGGNGPAKSGGKDELGAGAGNRTSAGARTVNNLLGNEDKDKNPRLTHQREGEHGRDDEQPGRTSENFLTGPQTSERGMDNQKEELGDDVRTEETPEFGDGEQNPEEAIDGIRMEDTPELGDGEENPEEPIDGVRMEDTPELGDGEETPVVPIDRARTEEIPEVGDGEENPEETPVVISTEDFPELENGIEADFTDREIDDFIDSKYGRQYIQENYDGYENFQNAKNLSEEQRKDLRRRVREDSNPDLQTRINKAHNKAQSKRAIRDSVGKYGDGLKHKFARSVENAQPVRSLGRLAAGVAGGAFFGTLGLAAGVASGDAGKAAQYAGVAAIGGNKIARNSFDRVSGALDVEGVEDAYERARLGEEAYNKKYARVNQMKKAHDEQTISRIQEKMKISRQEAKKRAEEWAPIYMDEKINNVDDWITIEKVAQSTELSRDQAIAAYKISNEFDTEHKIGDKKEAETIQGINRAFKLGNEEEAAKYLDVARIYDDVSHDRPVTTLSEAQAKRQGKKAEAARIAREKEAEQRIQEEARKREEAQERMRERRKTAAKARTTSRTKGRTTSRTNARTDGRTQAGEKERGRGKGNNNTPPPSGGDTPGPIHFNMPN